MLGARHIGSFVVAFATVACAKFSSEDPPSDAGPSLDAGSTDAADAPVSPNDASALPCNAIDPPPLFCDDFDGEQALDAKWPTKMTAGGGATVTRNERESVTAPRSFVAEVGTTSIDSSAFVEAPLAGLTARVQLD